MIGPAKTRDRLVRRNRRWAAVSGILVLTSPLAGCTINLGSYIGIPSQFLSSVGGWDLSACGGSGLQTCATLMADNQTLIFGGRTADEAVRDTASDLLTTFASTVIGL